MAPDTFHSVSDLCDAPDTGVGAVDRVSELQARIARLQAESDAITRDFVRLHTMRSSVTTDAADLLDRIDRLILRQEADIVRIHGLLHKARSVLKEAEALRDQR